MAKAKKLPSGSWRCLVYSHSEPELDEKGNPVRDSKGKPKIKRVYESFTSGDPSPAGKREAEYQASEFAYKKKRQKQKYNTTFKQASDEYIKSKQNILSPSTIRGYRIMQRTAYHLMNEVALSKIIDQNLIQKQMNVNANNYSAKTLRNQVGFISAVMGYFGLDIGKISLKPKEKKSIPVPSKEDIKKIMEWIKEDPEIECQILLALSDSLRQSEIAGLKAKSIDGNIIHIRGARVRDEHNKLVYKETNKSDAGTRDVIAFDYLAQKLQERCKGLEEDEYLFDLTPQSVLRRFKDLLKKHNMYPYTIHSLRHYFAAFLHAQNVPDKYIMELGGWATDHVMKNVYQYTFTEKTLDVQKKINESFQTEISDNMQHEMQHGEENSQG